MKALALLGSLLVVLPTCWGNPGSGGLNWRAHLGGTIWGGPAEISEGGVVLGSENGWCYAYNRDGSLRWSRRVGNDVLITPAVGPDGTVFVGVDHSLIALASDGIVRWRLETDDRVMSAPAIAANGTIFFGSTDRSFYAVNPNGGILWTFPTQGAIYSSPAIGADGTLYFGSRDNHVYAVTSKGQLLWAFDTQHDVDCSPAIGPSGRIYIGSKSERLYALNPDGAVVWEFHLPRGTPTSSVLAPNGTVYVGSNRGHLHAIDSLGKLLWTWMNTNQAALSTPAVAADGILYLLSADGKAHAINPAGNRLWTYTAQSTMEHLAWNLSSEGSLLIGTDDGDLISLRGTVGPARSPWPMFRREPAHNASSFVQRRLANSYSPGLIQVVVLDAYPPAGVANYVIEDQPPSGWTTGLITHGGQYDAGSGKVKFGPFSDAEYRRLQYEVVAPLRDSGDKYFSGSIAAGGWTGTCLGDIYQQPLQLHPADITPVDGRIIMAETVAFGIAWRQSASWPAGPSPLPSGYVDKATELWRKGEYYGLATNAPAPALWINSTTGPKPVQLSTNETSPPVLTGSIGTAFCQMSNAFQPGQLIMVTLQAHPAGNTLAYALEDTPPAGWSVLQISGGGVWDATCRKVKWGPFYDSAKRQLTYHVKVPAKPTNTVVFNGQACFNGTNNPIIGQRSLAQGTPAEPWVKREPPSTFAPLWRQTIVLSVNPPSGISQYVVDEIPPPGWTVGSVSSSGFYDAVHQVIRFGPFFDSTPQVLTYEVIPPKGATGANTFFGRVLSDQGEMLVGGKSTLAEVPLHPCDQNPVDGILSLPEVVSYASVWKSGSNWNQKPNPIPLSYVTKAIQLWQQGEAYQYTTNAPDLPQRWELDADRSPSGIDGLNTNFATATGCSAQAVMPSNWIAGQSIRVQLEIIPASNVLVYAAEEATPMAWTVQSISDGGWWDASTGKLKWGPFFDHDPRTLSYELLPPVDETNLVFIAGIVCFDRRGLLIGGSRQLEYAVPANLEIAGFDANAGLALKLHGEAGQRYDMERTVDLITWASWLRVTNDLNEILLLDSDATNQSRTFYRAICR